MSYELCGCEQANTLLDALERAWCELAAPTTPKEIAADKIIRKALDAHHAGVLAYIKGSE